MRKRTPDPVDAMPLEALAELATDYSLAEVIEMVQRRVRNDQEYLQRRNQRLKETTDTDIRLRRELPILAKAAQILVQLDTSASP